MKHNILPAIMSLGYDDFFGISTPTLLPLQTIDMVLYINRIDLYNLYLNKVKTNTFNINKIKNIILNTNRITSNVLQIVEAIDI